MYLYNEQVINFNEFIFCNKPVRNNIREGGYNNKKGGVSNDIKNR